MVQSAADFRICAAGCRPAAHIYVRQKSGYKRRVCAPEPISLPVHSTFVCVPGPSSNFWAIKEHFLKLMLLNINLAPLRGRLLLQVVSCLLVAYKTLAQPNIKSQYILVLSTTYFVRKLLCTPRTYLSAHTECTVFLQEVEDRPIRTQESRKIIRKCTVCKAI
jgi:hypothetical protein